MLWHEYISNVCTSQAFQEYVSHDNALAITNKALFEMEIIVFLRNCSMKNKNGKVPRIYSSIQ